ncbi:shematrin-like 2 [Crotalus adamanteus]|uniref:Shematrin-like 2 n=1 Tax=Crotalus adamanteus TaxID=8729 RepID=A0AAW1AM61_CROAD
MPNGQRSKQTENDLIIRFHLSSCPLIKKGLCGRGVGAPISHPVRGQKNPIKGLDSLETSHSKHPLPITFSILFLQEPDHPKMSYCGSISHVPYASNGSYAVVPSYGSSTLTGLAANYYTGSHINCSSQLTGSELIIQPPASVVSIPGPILSSTYDPVSVSQVTPCSYTHPLNVAYGAYGRLGYSGYGNYGGWRRYSRKCLTYN